MEKVIELAYELKALLENDSRILNLNKDEESMKNDNKAMELAYKKDMAIDEYEFALSHFSKDSKEVEAANKKLHEAKLALDSNEIVAKYLKSYAEVRYLYMEINNILFSIINQNLCEGSK